MNKIKMNKIKKEKDSFGTAVKLSVIVYCFVLAVILYIGYSVPCKAETFAAPNLFSNSSIDSNKKEWNTKKWTELESNIVMSKDNTITIQWQGMGGSMYMLEDFLFVVKHAQQQGKKIILNLTGNAASAHAFAACYVDQVNMNNYYLVFHAVADKNDKVYTDQKDINIELDFLNPCVQKGILDNSSLYKAVTKYEVWVSQDEKGNYHRQFVKDPRQE